ncbi:MAG: hypothetical protein L6Q99_10535 [Planctomycetes bacterium]|nr:hypothetical protein [Planctomycetota bacterium]
MKLHAVSLCFAAVAALAITFVSSERPRAAVDPHCDAFVAEDPSSELRPDALESVAGSAESQPRRLAAGLELRIDVEFEGVPATPLQGLVTDERGQVTYDARLPSSTSIPLDAPGRYTVTGHGRAWQRVSSTVEVAPDRGEPNVKLRALAVNGVRGWVFANGSPQGLQRFRITLEARIATGDGGEMRGELFAHDFTSAEGEFCISGIHTWGHEVRLLVDAGSAGRGATDWLAFDGTHWISDLVIDVADRASVTGSVYGRVVDADTGLPVEHAVIRIIDAERTALDAWRFDGALQMSGEEDDDAYQADPRACEALSESDGSFSIRHAPPRNARLLVIAPARRPFLTEPIAIEPGVLRGPIDVELTRGAAIFVRVVEDHTASAGHRRQVWLSGPGPRCVNRVSDQGESRFDGLADGTYRLELRDDLGDGALPIVAGRSVTIADGKDVEIAFQTSAGLSSTALEGRVELPSEPVPMNWRVFVLDADLQTEPEASAPVDADGHFEVNGVAPGRKLVAAIGMSRDRSRYGIGARTVEVPPFTRVRTDLEVGSHMIRVALSPGGTPSAGQTVHVATADTQPDWAARVLEETLHPVTDRRGELCIWGLPQGKYMFTAGGVESRRIDVTDEQVQPLEITLD